MKTKTAFKIGIFLCGVSLFSVPAMADGNGVFNFFKKDKQQETSKPIFLDKKTEDDNIYDFKKNKVTSRYNSPKDELSAEEINKINNALISKKIEIESRRLNAEHKARMAIINAESEARARAMETTQNVPVKYQEQTTRERKESPQRNPSNYVYKPAENKNDGQPRRIFNSVK